MNKKSLQDVSEGPFPVSLTQRGRLVRVLLTLIIAALLLTGTAVGDDDDFPFGPFRMYASTEKLDTTVADTRLEAVDATGRRWNLTEADTGIRRAEIEGQLNRFVTEPARLSVVARAYRRRNPDAGPLARIDVVVRWHEVRGGRPTGRYRDETKVVWHP